MKFPEGTGKHSERKYHRQWRGRNQKWEKGDGWPYYESNIYDYFTPDEGEEQYTFDTLDTIENLQKRMESMGEDVFGIDLMGQGKPILDIGCTSAIGTTLDQSFYERVQNVHNIDTANIEMVFGDVTLKETQANIIKAVDKKIESGQKLGVVFFRPFDGIGSLVTEEVKFGGFNAVVFYQRILLPLIDRLESSGVMFLELGVLDPKTFGEARDHLLTLTGVEVKLKKGCQVLKITKD